MFARQFFRLQHGREIKSQIRQCSFYRRGVHIFIKKNLFLVNSLTSGGCMFLGDLVQQEFEYQSKMLQARYDWGRLTRMLIMGMCMGPLHHYYYIYLDKFIPKVNMRTVSVKIVCDQTIVSPLTLVGFFYGMGYLEGKSLPESTNEVKTKLLYTYLGDCLYWPPIQFINFYFLPTQYRVVYINVATMIFNIFLSFMKHFDQH